MKFFALVRAEAPGDDHGIANNDEAPSRLPALGSHDISGRFHTMSYLSLDGEWHCVHEQ